MYIKIYVREILYREDVAERGVSTFFGQLSVFLREIWTFLSKNSIFESSFRSPPFPSNHICKNRGVMVYLFAHEPQSLLLGHILRHDRIEHQFAI